MARMPAEFGEKRTCFELDDLVIVVSNILSSICNAVMAGLAGGNRLPALNGDRGRDKILFSDGVLLNLPDLSQRKARPSDRMGVRADQCYVVPHPSNIFDQVLAFLETRAQGLEDNEQGRKVIEFFQQLASDECELVTLLRRYGSLRLGSVAPPLLHQGGKRCRPILQVPVPFRPWQQWQGRAPADPAALFGPRG